MPRNAYDFPEGFPVISEPLVNHQFPSASLRGHVFPSEPLIDHVFPSAPVRDWELPSAPLERHPYRPRG